jgi:chromosome segregation ATPase
MSRLKDNDKVVQERINLFDKDMLELQSKLVEVKDGLTKTMESQLEQEKTKMKMNNEDYIKSKENMNENIKKLNMMLEKSQQNQEDIKIKHIQSVNSKSKEIDEHKNIIEEQKCKMQETDNLNRSKLAILERDLGSLRLSMTDKEREINEYKNHYENENKMLQLHFDRMMTDKNQELSGYISINTDIKGQIEQFKYGVTKLQNELESEKSKNQNLQNQLNITCSQ